MLFKREMAAQDYTPNWILDLCYDGELQTGVSALTGVMGVGLPALGLILPSLPWLSGGEGRGGGIFPWSWGCALSSQLDFLPPMFRENKYLLGLFHFESKKKLCILNRKVTNGLLGEKLDRNNETEKKPLCLEGSYAHHYATSASRNPLFGQILVQSGSANSNVDISLLC